MLIGVDHGNKQIKTVHCNPFVSGLKQSVTRPFGQNVLRYQNTYYTLSTERIPYRKDKTEDDRFFILTLFALAGEIEARGAYSSEVQRIQLAVGLPPAHFGAQVERFTQYFGQRGMVEFEVQGKPYSIYIEDVACFPQAYAAAATMLHTLVEEPKAVILDIGGFTADYLLMKNGEIDLTSCDSLENGVILPVRHTNALHGGKLMTAGNDIGHNQIDEVDQAHQSKYSTYHSANQQDNIFHA